MDNVNVILHKIGFRCLEVPIVSVMATFLRLLINVLLAINFILAVQPARMLAVEVIARIQEV